MRTIRILTTVLAASVIAAPAIPAMAGGSQERQATAASLTASALQELGAPASLVAALHHPDDPQRLYPYVRPVGDLDGDGAGDVVTFTRDGDTSAEVLTATARKGTDGSALFTKNLGTDGIVTLLESGPVGTSGADGLLLGIYNFEAMVYGVSSGGTGISKDPYGERPFSYSTTGVNVTLTLMALGSDGSVVWQRSFTDGKYAYTGLTLAVVQHLPVLTGSLQAVPGAPKDVTVALYDRTPTANNSQDDAVQLQTIDGQNGQTVSTKSIDIDNTEAPVAVAPDLDGDGFDDLTLRLLPAAGTTPVSTKTLVALRGSNGMELWRNGTLALSRDAAPVPAGDVNGDSREDLLLTEANVRTSSSSPAQHVTLIDGRTGVALLGSDADAARPLGDIDGDGSADVLLSSAFYTNTSVEIVHEVIDGTGTLLWEKSFEVAGNSEPHAQLLDSPGDVDGDGVADFAHHMDVRKDTSTPDLIEDERVLSGRTGQTIHAGDSSGFALGGSLDGSGDDVARLTPFGTTAFDVSGVDGRTGAERFSTRLRPRGDRTRLTHVDGSDVTGDGIVDLVVNMEGEVIEGPQTPVSPPEIEFVWDGYVLNGRTGAILWSTDPQRLPVQPNRTAKVSAGSPYAWNGTVATGLNGQVTPTEGCSTDDPSTMCETVLVEFSSVPEGGAASATKTATITLDQFGPAVEPASDFDLYVYESDALGTAGPLAAESESGGNTPPDPAIGEKVTIQVTTTNQEPSHYYLVQVVYFRSVQSGYHGSASFA